MPQTNKQKTKKRATIKKKASAGNAQLTNGVRKMLSLVEESCKLHNITQNQFMQEVNNLLGRPIGSSNLSMWKRGKAIADDTFLAVVTVADNFLKISNVHILHTGESIPRYGVASSEDGWYAVHNGYPRFHVKWPSNTVVPIDHLNEKNKYHALEVKKAVLRLAELQKLQDTAAAVSGNITDTNIGEIAQ